MFLTACSIVINIRNRIKSQQVQGHKATSILGLSSAAGDADEHQDLRGVLPADRGGLIKEWT
jgi:hypothetical protein